MFKLMAIDCDGTLLDSHKKLSNETIRWVKEARDAGIAIVIASARPYYRLKDYLTQLGIINEFHYTVAFNGALVINNGTEEEIINESFDAKDISLLISLANKVNPQLFLYTKDGIIASYYDEEYVKRNPNTNYSYSDLSVVDFNQEQIYKVAFVNTPDVIKKIKPDLYDKIGSLYSVSSSVPQFVEVVNKGISKSKALERICQLLGISNSEVVAFGDEDNDIPMMEFAGYSIAMGNASDNVKNIANYITTSNDDNGVAKAIRHILYECT